MSGTIKISPKDAYQGIFDISFKYILDQENLYLKSEGLLSNQQNWQAIARTELEKSGFDSVIKFISLKDSLSLMQDGSFQSESTDKQVKASTYNITALNTGNVSLTNSSTSLTLNNKDKTPLKSSLSAQTLVNSEAMKIGIENQYSNFGQKEKVSKPDPSSITPITLKEFLNYYGFYSINTTTPPVVPPTDNSEVKGRDARRKTDLNQLGLALEEYRDNVGTYPISNQVEKTNNSTILKSALVSTYITALPVDPQDPQYWYGYSSDGYTYKLTSIIEDTADSGALKGSNVFYQEVKK